MTSMHTVQRLKVYLNFASEWSYEYLTEQSLPSMVSLAQIQGQDL